VRFDDQGRASDRRSGSKSSDKEKGGPQFSNKVHPGSRKRDRSEGAVVLNIDTARSGQSNDAEDQQLLASNKLDDQAPQECEMSLF